MVVWKEDAEGKDLGDKANQLTKVGTFNVPNFFVITPSESEQLFGEQFSQANAENKEIDQDKFIQIKECYKEVGMSSEVRNAVGKAKNLVGGQRNNQKVSIRISDDRDEVYDFEIDVGESNLENALKKVAASYYEKNQDHPNIIIQKRVEAEYTGSCIINYGKNKSLVEVNEGNGVPLENGASEPYLYLFNQEGKVENTRKPEKHFKVNKNPINGETTLQKVEASELPFQKGQVQNLITRAKKTGLNLKFAFKRGTFYVVDAWQPGKTVIDEKIDSNLKGIKVSPGQIKGKTGSQVKQLDKPEVQGELGEVVVASRGSFISRQAKKARQNDIPAVFSYSEKLEQQPDRTRTITETTTDTLTENKSDDRQSNVEEEKETERAVLEHAATDTVALDPGEGEGLYIKGFEQKLIEDGKEKELSSENFITSAEEALLFESDTAVVDARKIDEEITLRTLEIIEPEKLVLAVRDPSTKLL
ncbi:MAG: hypothetical protein ABEJ83_05020, partial [Candidatus Nanohaloarchaea archaeon]